ncbi:MAG: hypothetical protein ACE5D0_10240 [Fidelibacterota bacterium]
MDNCKLCNKEAELIKSHIYPKFIGKWMKTTGGDRFRFGSNMNKPEQDFPKQRMLCTTCENQFSKWEKKFSETIFKPLMNNDIHNFEYENWLFRFLVSVLWRTLNAHLLKPLENNQNYRKQLDDTEYDWRLFLNGDKTETQFDNIQVFLVSEVKDDNLDDISGLDYYLLRAVDSDICSNEKMCLVYLKLARFIIVCPIVGNIHVGINVINGRGILKETTTRTDKEFGGYLFDRIKEYDQLKVSDSQQVKIEDRFRKNIDKIKGSDLDRIMRLDFERQNGK